MMRRFLTFLTLAAVAAMPLGALAGESSGYTCTNQCPLAKQANGLRSDGTEADRESALVRAEVAKHVLANLERI